MPDGAGPAELVTVTVAVTDCPRAIWPGGLRVGGVMVGATLFTVKVAGGLVEPKTLASPL